MAGANHHDRALLKEGREEQVRHAFHHGDSSHGKLWPSASLAHDGTSWLVVLFKGLPCLRLPLGRHAKSNDPYHLSELRRWALTVIKCSRKVERENVTIRDPMRHVASSPRARQVVYLGKTGVILVIIGTQPTQRTSRDPLNRNKRSKRSDVPSQGGECVSDSDWLEQDDVARIAVRS